MKYFATNFLRQIFALALLIAAFAFASAIGGGKDIAGNYYDFTTGQVASSFDGRVYNPVHALPVAHSYVAHHAYAAPIAHYGAPLLFK